MFVSPGNYARALRNASQAMIEEGYRQEALLQPSEFDDVFSIDNPWWPWRSDHGQNVTEYIDEADQQGKPIDFAALQGYVFTRLEVAFNKNGVIYDPIDDADFAPIPSVHKLWPMLRPDQIELHLDEILASGANVRRLAYHPMSPEFAAKHHDKLVAAGVEIPQNKRKSVGAKIVQLFRRSK